MPGKERVDSGITKMPGTAQQFAIKQHLHVEMANEEGESRIKRYRTREAMSPKDGS